MKRLEWLFDIRFLEVKVTSNEYLNICKCDGLLMWYECACVGGRVWCAVVEVLLLGLCLTGRMVCFIGGVVFDVWYGVLVSCVLYLCACIGGVV